MLFENTTRVESYRPRGVRKRGRGSTVVIVYRTMRSSLRTIAALGVVMATLACRRTSRSDASDQLAVRTIFTDSALHAEHCEPVKPSEDWRRVCVPRDQRPAPILKKP